MHIFFRVAFGCADLGIAGHEIKGKKGGGAGGRREGEKGKESRCVVIHNKSPLFCSAFLILNVKYPTT
jgi:hypothetical protein